MKKLLVILLTFTVCICSLCSCATKNKNSEKHDSQPESSKEIGEEYPSNWD